MRILKDSDKDLPSSSSSAANGTLKRWRSGTMIISGLSRKSAMGAMKIL